MFSRERSRTKGQILETAVALFAQSGYHGVSTRSIASAANVSEVTIYRYYPRKRDLFLATVDFELQKVRLRGDLLTQIAQSPTSRMALVSTFNLISITIAERPHLPRLLQYSIGELDEDLNRSVRRHLSELIEVLSRYIEQWIARGDLLYPNAKDLVLAMIAIAFSHASLRTYFPSQGIAPGQIFEAYANELVIPHRTAGAQNLTGKRISGPGASQ